MSVSHKMIELGEGDFIIVGDPLHSSKSTLISEYKDNSGNYLKNEGVNSVGSYFLHDPYTHRIITSPGYVGGYISKSYACTVLKPILHEFEAGPLKFHTALSRYLKKSHTKAWPYQSIFQSIRRLPPGCIISYEGNLTINTYIQHKEGSFEEAIEKSVAPLETHDSIGLMYSGGVDSTALYGALQQIDTDVSAISIDFGPNMNNADQALRIGDQIGADIETINYNWPPTDTQIVQHILDQMSIDLVDPFNPHHAFAVRNEEVVLSGQNFDAMLTGDMHRPQISLIDHFLATKSVTDIAKYVLPNIQYTAKYLGSNTLQGVISSLLSLHKSEWSGSSGEFECLAGILSSGYPNILDETDIEMTVESLSYLSDSNNGNISFLSDIINYHQYQHNVNKVISTQPVDGTSVYLPAMWAPFASRFLGRPRSISEAYRPKPQVYDYVKKQFDIDYEDVAYSSRKSYKKTLKRADRYQSTMNADMLSTLSEYVKPDILLSMCPPGATSIMQKKLSLIEDGQNADVVEKSVYDDFYKLLNLSLLVSNQDGSNLPR